MLKKTLLGTAAAVAVLSFTATVQAEENAPQREKCYGVVKAGKNDCGAPSAGHSCAGQAKKDGDATEWVFVPKGLCERLANGTTAPQEKKS